MVRANLVRTSNIILLAALCHVVVSPPSPPTSSQNWLEDFLAMDWKEAAEFSKQMVADKPREDADLSSAAGVMSHPTVDDATVVNLSPSPGTLPEHTPMAPTSHNHITPLAIEAWIQRFRAQEHAPPIEAAAPIQSGSDLPSNGLKPFSGATEQEGTRSLAQHVSAQPFEASGFSQLTLPGAILIPDYYSWQPSSLLMKEMKGFIAGIDRRLLVQMTPLSLGPPNAYADYRSVTFFRSLSKAMAIQLPSDVVLVKFSAKGRLVSTNPFARTMTVWTVKLEDAARARFELALRGVWGVSSGIQLEVTQYSKADDYSVQRRFYNSLEGFSFLERRYSPFDRP